MQTKTKPDLGEVETQWPPLAHITSDLPVREGSIALCGAKLMGIPLNDRSLVCQKCKDIACQS